MPLASKGFFFLLKPIFIVGREEKRDGTGRENSVALREPVVCCHVIWTTMVALLKEVKNKGNVIGSWAISSGSVFYIVPFSFVEEISFMAL